MFEVPVTQKWFETESTSSFIKWAMDNNIKNGDWNFITSSGVLAPKFLFRHEADVLAFKLRFEL